MAKKLRKLRIREVSLCRQGQNPEASIVLHKAADPAPEFPSIAEVAKALTGASPEVLAIFKSQIDEHNRMLAEFSIDKQESNMTDTDPNHHFNKAVADYAARHDLPISKAAVDILSARPDLVEQAYTRDGQTAVAREQAKVAKLYGGAA